MAYQEYVQKAINTGKTYDELPAKVKSVISLPEWKVRVRELCIQQGSAWDNSQARAVCTELDYYESLISTYKTWGRLYPYHLAEYIARVLRVTAFRYYIDLLFLCLKEERSYDRIPNFTAADALRLTGVGRNEYIAILNACKSKRLMWRLNKGLARELLPQAPPDIRMEPWWRVAVVNVGESEFRDLTADESSLLRAAADGPKPLPVSTFDPQLLQLLYKKGLIYLHIPIAADDRFSIPPLEGFVSNKTSEAGDESVDPLEPLLYRLFLANSSRLDQARLADILGTNLGQLQLANSLAVRLGFATRLNPGSSDDTGVAASSTPRIAGSSSVRSLPAGPLGLSGAESGAVLPDSVLDESGAVTPAGERSEGAQGGAGLWGEGGEQAAAGDGSGGAVAVVVDAETTSFLMMGALSSGLKRHSVSLFEGGRVSGEAVVHELISELRASAAAGAMFEGEDMAQLMRVIESLGVLLACVKAVVSAQGHQLELLRQESFAGLDPLSAAKVLSATYTAIIPISPLPGHTLPRLLCRQLQQQQPVLGGSTSSGPVAAPAFFGPPSPEADSPWLQLALYSCAAAGPVSLVFVAGCRVWKLPAQLQGCTHALLWGWGPAVASGAAGGSGSAVDSRPLLVEGSNLLCTLNELLSRAAVMVQPLVHLDQLPPPSAAAVPAAQEQHLVRFVDVPLPLCPAQATSTQQHSSSTGDGDHQGGASSLPAGAAGPNPAAGETAPAATQQQAFWDPFGIAGAGQAPAAATAGRVQQQQGVVVQAVDRTGGASGQCGSFEVPAAVVSALHQLQLSGAVGWLRLVWLPPPAAAAAGTGATIGHQKQPWVPLSVNLGVPLFCPRLCQLVCDNMAQQQCLTTAGQTAWRAAQQQLQQRLMQHVGGTDRCSSRDSSVTGMQGQGVLLGAAEGLWSSGAGGMPGGGVRLPSTSLLFDGHSLLPVDVSGCLQGALLW